MLVINKGLELDKYHINNMDYIMLWENLKGFYGKKGSLKKANLDIDEIIYIYILFYIIIYIYNYLLN
jgi:hypothetical protein